MDDGLRINDLTQVFIGAGAKLSDPPSANSAPPRFNHHYPNSTAKKPVRLHVQLPTDFGRIKCKNFETRRRGVRGEIKRRVDCG